MAWICSYLANSSVFMPRSRGQSHRLWRQTRPQGKSPFVDSLTGMALSSSMSFHFIMQVLNRLTEQLGLALSGVLAGWRARRR
jgi:hypothetical protein